jgi:hypothetical protein
VSDKQRAVIEDLWLEDVHPGAHVIRVVGYPARRDSVGAMIETTLHAPGPTKALPLVRVQMSPRGPHVLAYGETPDEGLIESDRWATGMCTALPNQDILPMSTGVSILPGQQAQIIQLFRSVTCPKTLIYKIGRLVISNAGTSNGAADWSINDIKISGKSQFRYSGDVTGDVFGPSHPDGVSKFVRFSPVQRARDIVEIVITYVGSNERGCPFFGALLGTVIDTSKV